MDKQTKTPDTQPTQQPTHVDTSTPLGKLLLDARKKKGLNLDDIAEQTHILKRHLEALENNEFEALPQPTFARGFAINYGKHLGLDSHEIGQIFDAQYPNELKQKFAKNVPTPIQSTDTLERDSSGGMKFNPLILVGLILAVLLVYFFVTTINKAHKSNQTSNTPPAVVSPQEQATGASLSSTGSAITTITPNASIVASSSLPSTGTAIASVTAPTAISQPVASAGVATVAITPTSVASATSTSTGKDSLELWVKKPTNIHVTDANGQVILQGSHGRGGINLKGTAPFTINIDNVTNVSLNFNQQPIKLGQYAQNNQANFTLKNN